MQKRIVGWLVLVPLCALVLVFALANRHTVAIGFNPLVPVDDTAPGFGIPMFLIVYAVLFIGISVGGLAVWFTQGGHRRAEKRLRKENAALKADLARLGKPAPTTRDPALAAADELA